LAGRTCPAIGTKPPPFWIRAVQEPKRRRRAAWEMPHRRSLSKCRSRSAPCLRVGQAAALFRCTPKRSMGPLRMVQPDKPSRFGNFREMTTAD